jgi:hypothetical protein
MSLRALVHGPCPTPAWAPEKGLAEPARLTTNPTPLRDRLWPALIGGLDDLPTGVADATGRQEPAQGPAPRVRRRPWVQRRRPPCARCSTPRRLEAHPQLGLERPHLVAVSGSRHPGVEPRAPREYPTPVVLRARPACGRQTQPEAHCADGDGRASAVKACAARGPDRGAGSESGADAVALAAAQGSGSIRSVRLPALAFGVTRPLALRGRTPRDERCAWQGQGGTWGRRRTRVPPSSALQRDRPC